MDGKAPLLKREATTWLLLFLVDYGENISNLFGDLMKLDRFA